MGHFLSRGANAVLSPSSPSSPSSPYSPSSQSSIGYCDFSPILIRNKPPGVKLVNCHLSRLIFNAPRERRARLRPRDLFSAAAEESCFACSGDQRLLERTPSASSTIPSSYAHPISYSASASPFEVHFFSRPKKIGKEKWVLFLGGAQKVFFCFFKATCKKQNTFFDRDTPDFALFY